MMYTESGIMMLPFGANDVTPCGVNDVNRERYNDVALWGK